MGLTSKTHEFCFSHHIDDCMANSAWIPSTSATKIDTLLFNQQGSGGDNSYRWFNDNIPNSTFSCYFFGQNAFGRTKRCFSTGRPSNATRKDIIIYKLDPPKASVRDIRKNVMIYKYSYPVKAEIAINVKNKNDRPALYKNAYSFEENSLFNIIQIAYDDPDGTMVKIGDKITCDNNNNQSFVHINAQSLQHCQSICAKLVECVAITWYENLHFGTRCESHVECTNYIAIADDTEHAYLYKKSSSVHKVRVYSSESTPPNWYNFWDLISNTDDVRCHAWCIVQKQYAELDFEDISDYRITIEVEDYDNARSRGMIEIEVINRNEKPVVTDSIQRSIYENSKHGTLIPPAIQASDNDHGDEYECIIISGNLNKDSKVAFMWSDGTSTDQYISDCTLAVSHSSFFDYEHHQSFILDLRVRDLTSRAPGQLESDMAQVQISVVDLNEPPIFVSNVYMVNTEISLKSSTYNVDVDVNRGAINALLNGNIAVIQIETTQSNNAHPFSHGSIAFQNAVIDKTSIGLNVVSYSSSITQIKLSNGSLMSTMTFPHRHMQNNVKNRRTIIIEKVTGGRNIQVFVNGIESTTGTKFTPVVGNIYDQGNVNFGNGFSLKFDGILHRLSISKNRMFLANCTSCTRMSSKAVSVDEGVIGLPLIDFQALVMDNDSSDSIDNLDFSISHIYPTSGNSVFAISRSSPYLEVIGECDFEIEEQYIVSILVTDAGGLNDALSIVVSVKDVNEPPRLIASVKYDAPENINGVVLNTMYNESTMKYVVQSLRIEDPDNDINKVVYQGTTHVSVRSSSPSTISSVIEVVQNTSDVWSCQTKGAKYLVYCNNDIFRSNVFNGIYDSLSQCNLFISNMVSQNKLQCGISYLFSIKLLDGASLNYEESPTHDVEIKVRDAAGLSATGAITIFVQDSNDPPVLVQGKDVDGSNDRGRCSDLVALSDICVSARQNCRFGEYTGASIAFSDEDSNDILTFAIVFQRSRASGANSEWNLPGNDGNNQSDVFSLQQFGRTVQLYNAANEGNQNTLKNLGDNEYLLNISASDGDFLTFIAVTIILEEENFPPAFINCDSPLSILEYNLEQLQGDSKYTATSFTDPYSIKLKDSHQRIDSTIQNVRIDVIANPLFGTSSAWPNAIPCIACLYSDGGITKSGHATCCTTSLVALSPILSFQSSLFAEFYLEVVVLTDDNGPGAEQNFCAFRIYVADRNEAPYFNTNRKLTWETNETGQVPFVLGRVNITDPDEFYPGKSLTMRISSYSIGKNIDDRSLPNALDVLESKKYNAVHRLNRPNLNSNTAGPIGYVLRGLLSFDFETFDINQINITVEVTDNFKLTDKASLICKVLDINDPPFAISSQPNRYKIAENSYGGDIVVANLLHGDVFEDDDVGEVHTFQLYREGGAGSGVSATSCWTFHLDSRLHAKIPVKSHPKYRRSEVVALYFNVKSSGPIVLSLLSAMVTSTGVKRWHEPKDKFLFNVEYEITLGSGAYQNEVHLVKSDADYYGFKHADYHKSPIRISASSSESLLDKDHINSYWLKIESPMPLQYMASSTEISAGLDMEYGVQAAFDGNLNTYYLSKCDTNFTWVSISFEDITTVYGIQIFSSSASNFPVSYQIEGTADENLEEWENILSIHNLTQNKTWLNTCLNHGFKPCSVGKTSFGINPEAYRTFRIKIFNTGINNANIHDKSSCKRIHINEILFFADKNMQVVLSISEKNKYGSISIGKGRSLNKETILRYASTSPMNRIHEIGFSTKATPFTGEITSACLNNAELHERNTDFSVSRIFSVDRLSGTVRLASAIRGGPHGTLDFEAAPAYGFMIAVSDSGGLQTLLPILVDVLDVNEPPIFINSCPTDNSLIACPQISEKLNYNEEYGDKAFSSHILGFKYYRVYSASEARLSSNSNQSSPERITFDNTLGTAYVIWDVLYDLFSSKSYINIRLAYTDTEMCKSSCELIVEVDGIRKGPGIRLEPTSSFVKYTDSLAVHFSSDAIFQNRYAHEIKFKWEGSGLGPSLLHMEIFKGNNERLYSTSVINERLVASAGKIGRDNSFSPKHFYRYMKSNKVCREYYANSWYTLRSKSQVRSVEGCFRLCFESSQCNYFGFDNDMHICKLLYTCTNAQDILPRNILFFEMNVRPDSFANDVAFFGAYYMFNSPSSELHWVFPISVVKRSFSMKLRVRYKVEVPTSDLYVRFNIKVMHSSNHVIKAPVTTHWVVSESIEFSFSKNVVNSIILTVLRSGKLTFPTVCVDYMELYTDNNDKLSIIRAYDVDSSDTVHLDLVDGHSINNQDLFSIYPDTHGSTGNTISIPSKRDFPQHYTLVISKLIQFYENSDETRTIEWCRRSFLPCGLWQMEEVDEEKSPLPFTISAIKFNPERHHFSASHGNKKMNMPLSDTISKQSCNTFVELRPIRNLNPPLTGIVRLEAWIKISSSWNSTEGLLGLGLWNSVGEVLQSPNDLILYPPASSLSWELQHVNVYVGSHKVFTGAVYISSPCSSRTSILIYDIRIYQQEQLSPQLIPKANFDFDYEHQKVYNIKIRATDEGGLYAFAMVRVNLLDENERPNFMGSQRFTIIETLSPGSPIGVISAVDPDTESQQKVFSQLTFEIVLEEPQDLMKTAVVTSSYSFSTSENVVTNILDEDANAYWHTNTRTAWLTVDFLKVLEFREIQLEWKGLHSPTSISVEARDAVTLSSVYPKIIYENQGFLCGISNRHDIIANFSNKTFARILTIKFDSASCDLYDWKITNNRDCSGTNIAPSWMDGTISNFGLQRAGESSSIQECKDTCSKHANCIAFNFQKSSGFCSFWKTGDTGGVYITESTDHDCYEKVSVNTLKLASLRIYGTRVFSIDPTHPDLEIRQRETMLVLRDRQQAATQVSFLSKPTYEIYVKVSDFMNQYAEGLFQVQIIDANEAPILGRNISILSLELDNKRYVQENSEKGSTIGNPLAVFDPDTLQSHKFSIDLKDMENKFYIDPCSGQLEVVSSLNFEMRNKYSVNIRVEDDHAIPLEDTMTVTIFIIDVNESPSLLTTDLNVLESTWHFNNIRIITNGITVEKIETNDATVYKIEHDAIIGDRLPPYSWVKFASADKKYSCGPFRLLNASVSLHHVFSIKVRAFEDFQPMKLEHGFVIQQQNGTTDNDPIGTPLDVYDPDNHFYGLWFHTAIQTSQVNFTKEYNGFQLDSVSHQIYATGPYFDFEEKQNYVLHVNVWDNGRIYGWTNVTGAASLEPQTAANLYTVASINVNVINVNESPVCLDRVGARSYFVVENAVHGTILEANLGKYQVEPAHHLSDDTVGDIIYKLGTNQNTVGRLFIEGINKNCNLNSTALLRNGLFLNVWSKELCARKCEWQKACRSWQYNDTVCELYGEAAKCPMGSLSCWLYFEAPTSDKHSSGVTCGTLKSWNVLKNHAINGTIATLGDGRAVQEPKECATACGQAYNDCRGWDYSYGRLLSGTGDACALYAAVHNFIPMHNVSSGYFRPSEVIHNDVFAIDQKSGIITVDDTTSSPDRLNYEAYNVYIFSISARAYNSPALKCTGNAVVYVEDTNEPITLYSSAFLLSENTALDKPYEENALGPSRNGIQRNEIPMIIFGLDVDLSSTITYSVHGGPFGISKCSTCSHGQLYLIGNSLDYERQSSYTLIIEAKDTGNPTHTVYGNIEIEVKNEFERPLVYITNIARYVDENPVVGDVVEGPPIRCNDPDPFETLIWYIPETVSVSSTSLNPCGPYLSRQCEKWPRGYVKLPSQIHSTDMFSTVLLVDSNGINIDFEKEKSFSVPIRVRDR